MHYVTRLILKHVIFEAISKPLMDIPKRIWPRKTRDNQSIEATEVITMWKIKIVP